jgi:hypothetical protein
MCNNKIVPSNTEYHNLLSIPEKEEKISISVETIEF